MLPVVRAVSSDTLGQRQRAAEEHDVSVAGQSAEVAEEPAAHEYKTLSARALRQVQLT